MVYGSHGGFTYGDVVGMTPEDRTAYLDLLVDQKDAEEAAVKKAQAKARRPRTRVRR